MLFNYPDLNRNTVVSISLWKLARGAMVKNLPSAKLKVLIAILKRGPVSLYPNFIMKSTPIQIEWEVSTGVIYRTIYN